MTVFRKFSFNPADAAAMKEALSLVGYGNVEPAKWRVYFVDRLPVQPHGEYTAKCWGRNKIYIVEAKGSVWTYEQTRVLYSRILCHEGIHQSQISDAGGFIPFAARYILGYMRAGFNYRKNWMEQQAYESEGLATTEFQKRIGVKQNGN